MMRDVFDLSRKTIGNVEENIFFVLFYKVIGISIAGNVFFFVIFFWKMRLFPDGCVFR